MADESSSRAAAEQAAAVVYSVLANSDALTTLAQVERERYAMRWPWEAVQAARYAGWQDVERRAQKARREIERERRWSGGDVAGAFDGFEFPDLDEGDPDAEFSDHDDA